jgi:hypothetical protein
MPPNNRRAALAGAAQVRNDQPARSIDRPNTATARRAQAHLNREAVDRLVRRFGREAIPCIGVYVQMNPKSISVLFDLDGEGAVIEQRYARLGLPRWPRVWRMLDGAEPPPRTLREAYDRRGELRRPLTVQLSNARPGEQRFVNGAVLPQRMPAHPVGRQAVLSIDGQRRHGRIIAERKGRLIVAWGGDRYGEISAAAEVPS